MFGWFNWFCLDLGETGSAVLFIPFLSYVQGFASLLLMVSVISLIAPSPSIHITLSFISSKSCQYSSSSCSSVVIADKFNPLVISIDDVMLLRHSFAVCYLSSLMLGNFCFFFELRSSALVVVSSSPNLLVPICSAVLVCVIASSLSTIFELYFSIFFSVHYRMRHVR